MAVEKIRTDGMLARRINSITENWLLPAAEANPYMLEMFFTRDKPCKKKLLPWSGEFVGKHLTSLAYFYKLTCDTRIRTEIDKIVSRLSELDGYLGAFSLQQRFDKPYVNCEGRTENTWDCWGHYHILFGLSLLDNDVRAEKLLLQTADGVANFFLGDGEKDFAQCGSADINQALLHVYALLCNRYDSSLYRAMRDYLLRFHKSKAGGNMLGEVLAGKEFYRLQYPRWETLHTAQGYLEIYRADGGETMLAAVKKILDSILTLDVHNTGGFSSGEQAVGDPFDPRPIETCCTVAFCALCADYLQERPDAVIADYLERALYNAVLGSFHPSGRWSTYNTPMAGVRRASYDEIGFQCGWGSPELNCCSVNAPRGLGLLYDWAVTQKENGKIYLNHLGGGEYFCDGMKISVQSDYPANGNVEIRAVGQGRLYVRIPAFAAGASAEINRESTGLCAGEYSGLTVDGETTVRLNIPMRLHLQAGGGSFVGRQSVFYGPVLLACDGADVDVAPDDAETDVASLRRCACKSREIVRFTDGNVVLKDFASAGCTGLPYTSWLKLKK